jgi:hypothetical protein
VLVPALGRLSVVMAFAIATALALIIQGLTLSVLRR